jgi:two-component sensor histidine kinase/ABC-type amino acid transport substrate-binding protein
VFEKEGKPSGLFIDLVDHFAKSYAWKVTYVRATWSELLGKLEKGEIDLLPAVGLIPERMAIFDFSKDPVYVDSGVVFTSPNTSPRTVFDLQGKKVAAVRGSTFTAGFLDYIASFGIQCELVLTDTNPQVMEAIANRSVDAGVCIYSLGNELARRYPVEVTAISFSPIALCFAVPKGRNRELLAGIDSEMTVLLRDPDSIYRQSLRKWTAPAERYRPPAWLVWSLGFVLSLSLVLVAATVILKRQVSARTSKLREEIAERIETEERLKESLEEKSLLIRELYHRTKNTMQVIIGIISLKSSEYPKNKELQGFAECTIDRIQAMALVHQMLYQNQDLSRISMREYVETLVSAIVAEKGDEARRVLIELDVEPAYFLIDTVIPFGLVLNELMNNALVHAFPGRREGHIWIGFRHSDHLSYIFRFSDDGVGVPAGFDFAAQHSLGMRMIYGIGEKQLKGKVSFEGEGGVACAIDIPASLYKARV